MQLNSWPVVSRTLPKDLDSFLLLLLLLLLLAECNGSCRMKAKDNHTPEELADVVKNLPKDLATSYNIGLADFYPATSGKENAAKHIVEKFASNLDASFLMCDDDNDMGKQLASNLEKYTICIDQITSRLSTWALEATLCDTPCQLSVLPVCECFHNQSAR